MTQTLTYAPLRPDSDLDAVVRATALAFGGDAKGVRGWLDTSGLENIRVLRDGSAPPAASLLVIPMGQYFGGRAVPMQGIAGVAVAPESRGGGLALRMMQEQVREAARDGIPLSCLFASTQALYRQAGYEQAGLTLRTSIPLRTIGVRDRSMPVRELAPADEDAVRACYRAFASRFDGSLERGDYIWKRVHQMRDEQYAGFGVFATEEPSRLEGYLYMTQRRKPETGRHDVGLSDLAFTTARAGRRILGFLADLATIGDDAVLHGGPLHPLCTLMPQQHYTARSVDVWMIRVNLVKQALEARGYPRAPDAALTLEITDDLVPENSGIWSLRTRDGAAVAERAPGATGPSLCCHVRALACLYTGLYSATQAALLGLVAGEPPALQAADAIFAGPAPWMSDRF